MGNIIKQIKECGKVDLDNWYVWFNNNCQLNGPQDDDFRFADLASAMSCLQFKLIVAGIKAFMRFMEELLVVNVIGMNHYLNVIPEKN